MYEAGLLPEARSLELLEHASDCDSCGVLVTDMHTETQPERDVPLMLKSGTAAWKREMLRQIGEKTREGGGGSGRFRFRKSWLAAAAVVVAIVSGGAWWLYRENSPEAAFRLLAEAYTKQRPFELRIPGAAPGPLRVQRGGSVSPTVELAEAQSLIARKLESQPESAGWLWAGARADLLEWRYSVAIERLRQAQEIEPENPEILGDLGIAYLQRAEIESRPQDVAQAIDLLSQALAVRPFDQVLRFNRALAYERLPTPRSAIDDWEDFLRREPSGGWANEARAHLSRQEELIRHQADREREPNNDEDAIMALVRNRFRATQNVDPPTTARDLLERHRDPWMRDFLTNNESSPNQKAIELLGQVSQAVSDGDDEVVGTLAGRAVTSFEATRNTAGILASVFEQAYGFQRLSRPAECLHIARAALQRTHQLGYTWLEAQLHLTVASCLAGKTGFEMSYASSTTAQEIAERSGYSTLALRGLGFRATALRQVGAYRDALNLDAEGLRRYWSGEGNMSRAYQFYYDMSMNAAELRHPHTAAALAREAVDLAALQTNRPVEAAVRAGYGEILLQEGRVNAAEHEFDRSANLFQGLPAARLYRAYAGLSRAVLDAQENRVTKGLAQLQDLESMLPSEQNSAVEARLLRTKAELLKGAGRLKESEECLRRILDLNATGTTAVSSAGETTTPLAREVFEAVRLLTDRDLERADIAGGFRLWTSFNAQFQTAMSASRGEARLVFADLPLGLAVWAVDERGLHFSRLPVSGADLTQLSQTFRRLISDPNTSVERIRSLGRQIYMKLIHPVSGSLSDAVAVYVTAGEPFASVPFGALVTDDGSWFADRHHIVYAPPLKGVTARKSAGLTSEMNLLAVSSGEAVRLLQVTLPSLPDVQRDSEIAAAAFPLHSVLAGEQSTSAALLRALPQAAIFHFSGHVFVTASDAALVLGLDRPGHAQDRLLWASHIPSKVLRNCHLVVLAACSTGRDSTPDEDPSSAMARSFLMAGVPQVVATRWDVDSRATSAFVQSFYGSLRNGLTVEAAVSFSTSELRRHPDFAHPYYWAAFELFHS